MSAKTKADLRCTKKQLQVLVCILAFTLASPQRCRTKYPNVKKKSVDTEEKNLLAICALVKAKQTHIQMVKATALLLTFT